MPIMLSHILQPMPLQFPPQQLMIDVMAAMDQQAADVAVIVDQRIPVGIVTSMQVMRAVIQGSAIASTPVAEMMVAPVITAPLQTSLLTAKAMLQQHQLPHLIVTDAAGQLAGMVTEAAILQALFNQVSTHSLIEPLSDAWADPDGDEWVSEATVELAQLADPVTAPVTNPVTNSAMGSVDWVAHIHHFINSWTDNDLFCPVCRQVNVGIAVVGLDWKLRHTNAYLQNLLGYSAAELSQLDYLDVTYPEDRPEPQVTADDCIAAIEHSVSFEKRYVHKNGQVIWAQLTLYPLRDDQGQFVALVAVIKDIRQRKSVEAQVEFQTHLLQAVDDAVVAINLAGQITYWNQGAEKLYGWSSKQVQGRWIVDVLCPDTAQSPTRTLLEHLPKGQAWRGELNVQHRDGSVLPVLLTNSPIHNEHQELIGLVGVAKDLRDRKQIEEALRMSEERWQLAIQGTNDGVWDCLLEAGKETLFCSRRWNSMLGYDHQDFLGKESPWSDLIHPDDRDRTLATQQAYLRREIPTYACEHRLRCKDGSYKWILARGQAVWDENGKPVRMVGFHTDIDDRKRAEIQLQETSHRLWRYIENSPLASVELDKNLKIKYWSSQAEAIFGWTSAEILGKSPMESNVICEADTTSVEQLMDKLLTRQISSKVSRNRNYTKSGQVVHCVWFNSAIYDADGQLVSILSLAQDVTEQVNAQQALADSEERLRLVIDAVEDGIWDWDIVQNISFWSEQCYRLLGVPSQTAQRNTVNNVLDVVLGRIHPDDQTLFRQTLNRHLVLNVPFLVEFRARQADGSYRWLLARGKALRDHDGHAYRMVGTLSDICDRKQNELDLQQAKIAAEQANQAKSQFLASMSHELRTPLNSILGFAQVLSWDNALTPRQARYINIISQSGQHLLQLINSVLEMSRIEAGHLAIEKTAVKLQPMLATVKDLFQLKAKQKRLKFRIEPLAPLPEVITTDERKLRQILINLLGNAIKFTPKGRVTLRVFRASWEQSNSTWHPHPGSADNSHWLHFEVSDTGLGIAEAELDRLFQTFAQTAAGKQSYEGAGLGLAISQSYAQLMGGFITVKSQVNQGSTFTLVLPTAPAAATPPQPTAAPFALPSPSAPSSASSSAPSISDLSTPNVSSQDHSRILIVEDKPDNRLVLAQLLAPLNCQVKQVVNGQAALTLLQHWQPDLVLMDIQLPILDGYETTRRIKTTPQGQNLPIIAVTSYAFESERKKILAAGCDDCISKPIEATILFETLSKYLKFNPSITPVESNPATTKSEQTLSSLSSAPDLTIMSQDWIQHLHQASMGCYEAEVLNLINLIPDNKNRHLSQLKNYLQHLAQNFQFDVILELTQRALK